MGTRKLGRPTAHRMSMLYGMVTYLLENGKIETTLTRAKEVSSLTDKMITLGKKGNLAAYRRALAVIPKEDVAKKLFDVIAPSFADCNGGYTTVYKMGPRRGDGAEMALITLKGYTLSSEDKKAEKAAPKAEEAAEVVAEETVEEVVEEETAEEVVSEEVVEEEAAEAEEEAPAEEAAEESAAEEPAAE